MVDETLFRMIAHKLHSFHQLSYFCGDLYNSVRVFGNPELSVSFPYAPTKSDSQHNEGLNTNLVYFRYLVSFLLQTMRVSVSEHQFDKIEKKLVFSIIFILFFFFYIKG
jgi:hypothetical protein